MTLSLRPPDWRLVLAALGLACALAVAVSGCGASAVRDHATAATVLTVAVRGAGDLAVGAVDLAGSQCEDAACVDRVEDAASAVAVAHEGLRLAAGTYRDAVEVAAVADQGEAALLGALVTALARTVARWDEMVTVLRDRLAVDLPLLPPMVRALLGALGGE